ncbi:MAG: chemotaxis protein CheW [Coxiellaceae bacterium]|nr:chemotaxis protein CheW [Coxiellaceae bacterium]
MTEHASEQLNKHQRFLQQFDCNDELSILDQRAKQYIKKESNEKVHEEEYIHFKLGKTESYAISYRYVEEILNPSEITSVPCTPSHIAGVVNRRSSLLAVYDLKQLFSLDTPVEKPENIWVIVISCDEIDYSACILADEIYGNENYVIEDLASPLQSAGVKNLSYVKGIIDGKITLLDVPVILSDDNLKVSK